MVSYKYCFLSVLLIGFFCTSAQQNEKSRFSLEVGLSSSKDVSFSESITDNRSIFSPTIGFGYSFNIGQTAWIQTGLEYFQVGDIYRYYTGFNSERTDVRIHVNTLKVPVLLKFEFGKKEEVSFYLQGGPSFDIIIGESKIKAKDRLNNPDGFRNNIPQGTVVRKMVPVLNVSLGINFKKEEEVNSYLELGLYGKANGLFEESDAGNGQSQYLVMMIKLGKIITRRKD